ncbi:dihydroneopterin triphosphate diphosphatase [Pasteurella multocida]|uniref:dihydroneopterin triphosphate diphosphatase n=1 Tax=Pasteurella multocida TaxID=747 RepID=UPI0028EE1D1A|nr:dihydroneopterin triphosphate diphosphatase [Pasteurella multocida]
MKMYKNPHTVLVVIFCYNTQRVLMLQRQDDPTFWQSVTGSLALNESPRETAIREVKEEVGIDIQSERLALFDCEERIAFEIFPHFRYKYAPNVTHCLEHWFLLGLAEERIPHLTEHVAFQWLPADQAAILTKSWNNRALIEKYLVKQPLDSDILQRISNEYNYLIKKEIENGRS